MTEEYYLYENDLYLKLIVQKFKKTEAWWFWKGHGK